MNNNNTDALLKKWEKAVKSWASAIKKGDVEVADIMQKRTNDAYSEYKADNEYKDSTINATAGELGEMFESALPTLFVKNKKAVGEVINLIKEDSNLKYQLQFFEAMKDYDGTINAKDYINESLALVSKNIDLKTLKESNKKLGNLLVKYNIGRNMPLCLDESKNDYLKAASYLLSHKKTINNLSVVAKNATLVENYINEHKNVIDENKINIKKITEDFDKKMSMLNEDERALVNDIINSKSSVAEQRQRKFFNSLKEKCIKKIDKMISESNEEEKNNLSELKEEINSMEYCKESIVKDTAKLLEVGSVLEDK